MAKEQKALEDAEQRIAQLESRLRMTDETMTVSENDTKKQINFWESEIRKLWAVSNERNKEWIKKNEASLSKMATVLESLESKDRELGKTVGRHQTHHWDTVSLEASLLILHESDQR